MLLVMRVEADKTKHMKDLNIIWVGRVDSVYGEPMIALGKSEKEVENLLFKEYKAIGKELNEGGFGYNNNGSKTKTEFFEHFGSWVQPMAIGKCYSGDGDESRNLKKILA